jgi:xanthine dehydrogenase accessory factor
MAANIPQPPLKFGLKIVVRGSGDVGSAVAHKLFQAGYAVLIHDAPQPTVTRRKMAFTDAIFEGCAHLEGVEARRLDDLKQLPPLLAAHQIIPVQVIGLGILLAFLRPDVLVDARMRKHHQPEVQRGLAQLTIGLRPNFVAGETTDLAVETRWGDSLGQVLVTGPTQPLQGEPRPLSGHSRNRYVYTPVAGMFRTAYEVGDLVEQGQKVARIGSTLLYAPLTGILRGLTKNGAPVSVGAKVIKVDPRGDAAMITGIGERPGRIAAGVLQAVEAWEKSEGRFLKGVGNNGAS